MPRQRPPTSTAPPPSEAVSRSPADPESAPDVTRDLVLAVLDIAPQALVVARADGRAWLMNARARHLLGVADGTSVADWAGRLPTAGGAQGGGWVSLPRGDGGAVPCWVWSRPVPSVAGAGGAGETHADPVLHALWPCRVASTPPAAGEHPGLDDLVALTAHHALMGEMGGALAHQMSQPLNIIRLTAERAVLEAEQAAGSDTRRDPVVDRFARLADQAENLFDLMALVQGAPAVSGAGDLTSVDLGAVMNRAANLARGPLRAAGLKAELITPETMPLTWGEPTTLLQVGYAVLTELAESALGEEGPSKAGAMGRAARSPRTAPVVPADLDRALIVRVDLDAAAPGRLIVDLARDLAVEGRVPLIPVTPDLSVSRRVVLAAVALAPMGGHLQMLVDEQGALRGARLDLARVMSGDGANAAASADRTADRTGDDDRVRVLLAEDEIEAATEIADYLRDLDYDVRMVEDAPTGIRALDETTFDVVISDVSMPGGGAARLLRAVEAGHPDLAVILVSGLALEHDEARAELADMADAVLRKPIGLGQLRETLERVLAG